MRRISLFLLLLGISASLLLPSAQADPLDEIKVIKDRVIAMVTAGSCGLCPSSPSIAIAVNPGGETTNFAAGDCEYLFGEGQSEWAVYCNDGTNTALYTS